MLENGTDIRFIQQMLGHANLATTEIYARVATHKLKHIHRLTPPAKMKKVYPSITKCNDRKQDHDAFSEIELLQNLDDEADDES